MGRVNQPRDRRGRWTTTGAGARLGSQRQDFARALQHQGRGRDNDGRSTVYAYLRDKDSPSGKAGSPYYVGVAGDVRRPYSPHKRTPVPSDERRIRMLRSNVTHEQAREWEKYYIEKFGRKDAGTGRRMLINRTDGGEGTIGQKFSPQSRAKMSASQRGRTLTDEHKSKIAAAGKGRKPTDETRAKLAEANRGKIKSPETRAKISAAARNRSEETRKKIGESNKGRIASAETRAKMSAKKKGVSHSTEHVAAVASSRVRSTAKKYGIDEGIWARMTPKQRASAQVAARRQGISVAQQIEKMRSKWGV
jgi:hypothetical protein